MVGDVVSDIDSGKPMAETWTNERRLVIIIIVPHLKRHAVLFERLLQSFLINLVHWDASLE